MRLRDLWIGLTLGCLGVAQVFAASDDSPIKLRHALQRSWSHYETAGTKGAMLTMIGGGNFRFVQTFFYSDVACSSLLGVASITDNGAGYSFLDGESVRLNASTIYKLADNQGIATDTIACMKLYYNGGNQSSQGIDCQSYTDMTCAGTICSSQQTKTVSWKFNPAPCVTEHAYITSKNEKTVSKCAINNADGVLSDCVTTGDGFKKAAGVATNNSRLSIADESGNAVIKCAVNAASELLENCVSTGSGFKKPFALLYNDGYAYVASKKNDSVIKCRVGAADGLFSDCVSTGSGFNAPVGMSISNSYAYVVNLADDMVSRCTLTLADGSFSNCVEAGGSFKKPMGITLSNGYAYISDQTYDAIFKCTVSASDGLFSDCAETGSGFNNPVGIAMNNGYAYIGNEKDSTVMKCLVDEVTGVFSDCVTTGSGFNATRDICFC
jgi:hypothetical protein